MQILPIASGKGGVGKSLIATNLSIALAQADKQVVIADLDLGGSNIHLMLGQSGIRQGIGVFLTSSKLKFEHIVLDTGYKNLRFIPGDAEVPGVANLKSSQKKRLIHNLMNLDADYLIIDLGAGTHFNIIDFFLTSGKGIMVTEPTPTANLNAYLFLKNVIFRVMGTCFLRGTKAHDYIAGLNRKGSSLQRVYVPNLLEYIAQNDPESYAAFQDKIEIFHPMLILNMLEDPKDSIKADKLRRSCKEYLNVDMAHLGILYMDNLQDIALNSRLPLIVYKPKSVLSQAIYRIADKILQNETEGMSPLDFESLDDSYETAKIEAEVDFEMKLRYLEELLHCGALSPGDLIETIKIQQFEIAQLRKENTLLKSKLVKAVKAGFDE